MSKVAILGSLLATTAVAQSALAAPGWKYVGCVEASPDIFGTETDVSEPFSPAQCQDACGKQNANYAALGNGCHCDVKYSDIAIDFDQVDPMKCSVPCMDNDPDAGQCGAQPAAAGKNFAKQVYNLYQRATEDDAQVEARAEMTPAPEVATAGAATSTKLVTITSCPPDVPDCPVHHMRVITQTIPCPEKPTTTPTPTPKPVPIFTKYKNITEDCGCDTTMKPVWTAPVCPEDCLKTECPPQGCKPCPSGCPSVTKTAHGQGCPAYGCGTTLPTCPPGGCNRPPVVVNGASSQSYSPLALVGAGAIALAVCLA
ncbi:hypothetical protein K4F52_008668 [Lecanicillium sp. MT-2017a]|nr:hypothetical protein K4F52_008668 [Lecanicillium sp. MT-2017a]